MGGALTSIRDLVEAGPVIPHVGTVLKLAEVEQALALPETGRTPGQIVRSIATRRDANRSLDV